MPLLVMIVRAYFDRLLDIADNIQTVELPDGSIVAFTLGSSEVGGAANKGGPPKNCRHPGPPPPPTSLDPPTCGERGWTGGA